MRMCEISLTELPPPATEGGSPFWDPQKNLLLVVAKMVRGVVFHLAHPCPDYRLPSAQLVQI